jgi:hypothetical protein
MAPDAWTPDAWTPDVRLTDWTRTSAQRTEHADRATTGVAGVRTSSRPATNTLCNGAMVDVIEQPVELRDDADR